MNMMIKKNAHEMNNKAYIENKWCLILLYILFRFIFYNKSNLLFFFFRKSLFKQCFQSHNMSLNFKLFK